MGLEWNESGRRWEWEGDVQGLVSAVGNGDARLGFVVDKKTGAKISMNMDDDYGDEPFYIESPDGDNLYDAYNRKDAVRILNNIRQGSKNPDIEDVKPKARKKKKTGKGKNTTTMKVSGIRRK